MYEFQWSAKSKSVNRKVERGSFKGNLSNKKNDLNKTKK